MLSSPSPTQTTTKTSSLSDVKIDETSAGLSASYAKQLHSISGDSAATIIEPLKRYELIIVHVNNQKEQVWTVSKTVCLQILEQLRKGFRTFKVIRTGADRSTTYQIEGV
jgi:hypothetical protein